MVEWMLVIYFERKDLPGEINMKRSAGIVGVRRCTQLDKLKVSELTVNFIADNKTIVSGMSKEIDSYAHTASLNAGGYIIAIVYKKEAPLCIFHFIYPPYMIRYMYTCITKAHGRYTS